MSPMNNRILRPLAVPGVLDFAPGAAAAYSLRNLSLSYAGPVVTVRRSTDNAEADFTASEVSDGTLAGWAGADGFVKQWWDQSGNARHATQATAAAQPQIVDSGVLVTEGGKAAISFDGVDDLLSLASPVVIGQSATADFWMFCVFDLSDLATANGYLWHSSNLSSGSLGTDSGLLVASESLTWGTGQANEVGSWLSFPLLSSSQTIVSVMLDAATATTGEKRAYINGALSASAAYTIKATAAVTSYIGARVDLAAQRHDGTISELIIYPTDQTALRPRIEGNINRHFGVF